MKTRSAYVQSPWRCEVREIDLPDDPPPGQAIIRIEACGICGTDLTTASAKAANWQAFGHEIAGVIERIAPGSRSSLSAGQKVALESSSYCGVCELCRNGRVDLCNRAPNFWGQPAMGFGQYMLAPICCLVPYTDLEPAAACLAEPAGVAFDMVTTAGIQLGDRVCLVGPGPIGLMAIPLALRSGAREVVCVGRSQNSQRLDVATQLGGRAVVCDEPLDTRDDLRGMFDHVLLTAPVNLLPSALPLLAYGGRLTYIGIGPESGMITFDANKFHFRKLQLRASFASPAIYYPKVLQLLRDGIIPADKLVSHRFPLEKIEDAMLAHRDQKSAIIKAIVEPW